MGFGDKQENFLKNVNGTRLIARTIYKFTHSNSFIISYLKF